MLGSHKSIWDGGSLPPWQTAGASSAAEGLIPLALSFHQMKHFLPTAGRFSAEGGHHGAPEPTQTRGTSGGMAGGGRGSDRGGRAPACAWPRYFYTTSRCRVSKVKNVVCDGEGRAGTCWHRGGAPRHGAGCARAPPVPPAPVPARPPRVLAPGRAGWAGAAGRGLPALPPPRGSRAVADSRPVERRAPSRNRVPGRDKSRGHLLRSPVAPAAGAGAAGVARAGKRKNLVENQP